MRALPALFSLLALLGAPARGEEACVAAAPQDPPRLYLVTTSPGRTLFSAFGHSALWLSGGGLARPVVLDWGNFDSRQGEPVADFLAGRMVYTLEALTEEDLWARTRRQGKRAVAQRLDLPPPAMAALGPDVLGAARASDRGFAYDWLADNCSTRIRDALDRATGGAVSAQADAGERRSARDEVLRHVGAPGRGAAGWASWLGLQVILDGETDRPLTPAQAMFLPDRLMQGLRSVVLTWPDGRPRPLVGQECVMVEEGRDWAPEAPPARGLPLLGAGLAWAATVLAGRPGGVALALFALIAGAIGMLTAGLAIRGTQPGLGPTHLWWLCSPASLLLLLPAWALLRARVGRAHLGLALALALAGLLGTLLSAAGLVSQVLWPLPALLLPPLLAAPAALWRTHRSSGR